MTTTELTFTVHGTPAPQGSKRAFVNKKTGRAIIVEQQHDRVRSWRDAVKGAALGAMDNTGVSARFPIHGPIHIAVTFWLKRPAGHYGTGRNALVLKASAPDYPARMPDIDKLIRATFDALSDVAVWDDDGQVCVVDIAKQWARDFHPAGADIQISAMGERPVETVVVQEALV